jgi:uncharacterized protein (TIGR03437 family)
MIRKSETIVTAVLLGSLLCRAGWGENAPAAILQVDIENWVEYFDDTPDVSKLATNPNPTPPSVPKNFAVHIGIADIVAVNGQPVKGTMVRNTRNINLSTAPNPGQAIGDAPRGAIVTDCFEIQKLDGSTIGTIFVSGIVTGPPAPGAPLAVVQGNLAVLGGTGAFLGVTGQDGNGVVTASSSLRAASMTEDPANRRVNGAGGKTRWILHLIPQERPEIVMTANGPAVTHSSDFTAVSASNPAAAGEILSVFMTGLGPTKPGVDPGAPFPASPATVVNSPVAVTVNGESAEVLGAVGYPGAVDGYQVNVRVPPDIAHGTASIQVSAAWIAGPAVQIAVK